MWYLSDSRWNTNWLGCSNDRWTWRGIWKYPFLQIFSWSFRNFESIHTSGRLRRLCRRRYVDDIKTLEFHVWKMMSETSTFLFQLCLSAWKKSLMFKVVSKTRPLKSNPLSFETNAVWIPQLKVFRTNPFEKTCTRIWKQHWLLKLLKF